MNRAAKREIERMHKRALCLKRVVSDENLIEYEYYHEHEKIDVVWQRMTEMDDHVKRSLGGTGPEYILHRSKEFILVPHRYYTCHAFDAGHAGEPEHEIKDFQFQMVVNMGALKGVQNTKASSPDVKINHRRIRR